MRYVTGQVVTIFIFVVTVIILGGTGLAIAEVIDAPSLMPLIIVIAATVFMTGEYKTFTKSVNALLSKKYKISYEDLQKAIALYGLLAKVVVYTTLITFVLGFTLMVRTLYSPEYLGPMLSVALISVFYGLIANLVFIYPAIHILKHRENSESVKVISEKLVVDKLLELCYKKGISPEEILEADDISFGK